MWVGLFVCIKFVVNKVSEKVIVLECVIGIDLKNCFVFIVGEGNVFKYKLVIFGECYGSLWVIILGLNENDVIVVNGFVCVGFGMFILLNIVIINSDGIVFIFLNN